MGATGFRGSICRRIMCPSSRYGAVCKDRRNGPMASVFGLAHSARARIACQSDMKPVGVFLGFLAFSGDAIFRLQTMLVPWHIPSCTDIIVYHNQI